MDMDTFFYYGESNSVNDVSQEIKNDISVGLRQPKKTMFYDRDFGAGVEDYMNAPLSINTIIKLKYEIVEYFAKRNIRVADGSQGVDKRAITSQAVIDIMQSEGGNLDINLLYIAMNNIDEIQNFSLPVGGK